MKPKSLLVSFLTLLAPVAALAAQLDAKIQAKVDTQIAEVRAWAADAVVVKAVRAQNAQLPEVLASMTEEKWKSLHALDPLVRGLAQGAVGEVLKAKKGASVTEAFVSDAAGRKVGFLAKTSSWSHQGQPKHDVPMAGAVWQGSIEVDKSVGSRQLQFAVPVLDGGKPIGVLVVGLNLAALME